MEHIPNLIIEVLVFTYHVLDTYSKRNFVRVKEKVKNYLQILFLKILLIFFYICM